MTAADTATARTTSLVVDSAPVHEAKNPASSVRRAPVGRGVVAIQVLAALLWIPQAALIAYIIGNIASGTAAQNAILPAAGVFLLGLLRAVLNRKGAMLAFAAGRAHLALLRQEAFRALAGRSPLGISRPSSGEVASVIAEQAEAITSYLARFQPLRMKAAVVPLVIAAFVFSQSWVAALVLLAAAPVIPLFMALVGWKAKEASERQLVRMGDMNAFLLDRLRGLATIRSFDAVARTAKQLQANADSLRIATMAVLRIAFLSSAVLELFAALGVAFVAVYVGFHFLGELSFGAWGGKLTLAQGMFILLLAPAFFEPLRDLSGVWHDRASGMAAIEALEKLASKGRTIVGQIESGQVENRGALSVRVEQLSFAHAGQTKQILDHLDLSIEAGEHVAIMAPSGGGKSTLLALLAGLAPASSGSIYLNDVALTEENAADLRAEMAWLGQPPHIFSGTLQSNITLGRANIDALNAREALQRVQLDALAKRCGPSPIGENGIGLSGGEALRLALSRAAAGRHAGLILADEPTAHLDSETAQSITGHLLSLAKGKTLIVATHDPVLAARMDRIVTLPQIGVQS